MRYRCWFPDNGETEDDGKVFETSSHKEAAQLAAADYHANRSGWESSWPMEIHVRELVGRAKQEFCVERHVIPEFEACRLPGTRA